MNPYRLKDVFNYLTSSNQLLKRKLKLGTSEIPIPPKRSDVTAIEAINRFTKANPRVDTTSLKPLSVKHSNVRQSNVNEPNEGAIQSAFDTATRDAQFEGYPAPNYEKFKARYLKKNMKADGGRIGYAGAGLVKTFSLLKNLNKTGSIRGLEEKLTKKFRSEGMDLLEAIKKAQVESTTIKNKAKNKILDDAMKETDITSDDYVELIDQKIKIIEPEYYTDIKRWNDSRPDLADKTRALFYPDWAEAKYGENYAGVLQNKQAKAIRENIDPNVKEPLSPSDQMVSDIDDMNTANIDEFFDGRKKNAEGGRAGYEDGGRIGFMEGKLVKQGPNTGKIAVKDLKLVKNKKGKIISRQTKYFKDMETANAAIQKHKEGKSGQLKYKKSKKILNDPKLKSEFLKYSMGKDVTGKMIRKKYGLSNDEFFYGGLREIIDKDFLQYSKSQVLKSKTIKNMLLLHNNKLSKDFIRNGLIVPDDIIEKLGLNTSEAATASARLSQHYSGMDFGFKELKSIRRNSKSGNKLFEAMNKFSFGNPYKSKLYNISLQLIDDQLGNETGTFESLKKKASYILKKNKIKGFDINEIAGVTGTAKTGVGEFSQFVDIMDSNLNQKQMASFQAAFSVARQNILDNPNNFTTESKKINKLASRFEREYGVKLPRIRALNEVEKYYSPKRLEELKNQGLDIKAASKKLKYTVQMPPGAMTINEFVDQSTPSAKRQLNMTLELIKQKNPAVAKKVNIALNSGLPIDDIAREIARIPGVKPFARTFMKIGGPFEVAFLGLDIANEVSKGVPLDTSVQQGISNITLGLAGDPKKYQMRDLSNAASEIGVNNTGFQELKNILDLEKKIEEEKKLLDDMQFFNEESSGGLKGNFNLEEKQKDILNLEEQYKTQALELSNLKNFDSLFEDYNSATEYLARKEYNKTLDSRKDRVYPESGTMGSDFMTTIMNPIQSFLPQNLMETGLGVISNATRPYVRAAQKIPFIGSIFEPTSDAAKLSAMSQEEKDQRALDMNIIKQNYHPVMGTTMTGEQMQPYYDKFFSKGGIASLTKTIPPESGPTPHGLPSLMKRGIKI